MQLLLSKRGMLALAFIFYFGGVFAQFTNRYPKVDTYRHHIYLEAFEFPFYSNGPVSPVASPDGSQIAFSAFGWLWIYNKKDQTAVRLTSGAENDFLPTWSPKGQNVAFVRDTGTETYVQIVDLSGGNVARIDQANASELDPYYSPDGKFLYYTSSVEGTFDIWRVDLTTFEKQKIVADEMGIELRPVPYGQNGNFYFISKAEGVVDRIKHYDAASGEISIVDEGRILSQLWMDVNSEGDQLALNWSDALTWNLNIEKAKMGAPKLTLFEDEHYVIYPSWDRASATVLFAKAGKDLVFNMYEISADGGTTKRLDIKTWDFGAPTKTTSFVVNLEGNPSPARVSAMMENGHFVIPAGVLPRFDSQNGEIYFYTEGRFTLSVPSDKVKLKVSHGLFDYKVTDWIQTGKTGEIAIDLSKGWDKPGWYSGDHHFHLNYGGPYKLQPEDLILISKAEDLDFLSPMSANLHFQLKDQEYMNWQNKSFPKIKFGQEIRSHFHGHVGLFGGDQLFFPWFWGPLLYETHTYDDRSNSEALRFGKKSGHIGSYVHPISEKTPLANEGSMARIPSGLVADVVNGELDAFEMACLWSDEIGSSEVYHQFLNLGIPVAITAGTDAFPGYARSMAIGTTRIMVNAGPEADWPNYMEGIRKGRSLVTNGPMIELKVNGVEPGDVIGNANKGKWELEVFTTNKIENLELLVNGKVVWKNSVPLEGGVKKYSGTVRLPSGGWIAARVYGKKTEWPQMDSYPFAHTSPIWIKEIGSYDPVVRSESAKTLTRVLDIAWERIRQAYKDHSVESQELHFKRARAKLSEMISR